MRGGASGEPGRVPAGSVTSRRPCPDRVGRPPHYPAVRLAATRYPRPAVKLPRPGRRVNLLVRAEGLFSMGCRSRRGEPARAAGEGGAQTGTDTGRIRNARRRCRVAALGRVCAREMIFAGEGWVTSSLPWLCFCSRSSAWPPAWSSYPIRTHSDCTPFGTLSRNIHSNSMIYRYLIGGKARDTLGRVRMPRLV